MTTPEHHRGALLADVLRMLGGVALLLGLAVAPLYYGATRLLPLQTMLAIGATGSGAWLLSALLSRNVTLPPMAFRIGAGLFFVSVVAWGIFLVQPEWPAFTESHLARVTRRWPYSVVPRSFTLVLTSMVVLLAATIALADLARQRIWRRSIAVVILCSGASVALLGLIQNATRARGIYWDSEYRMPGAFFGTFFHHTSAGAYLNSVWPLGFALALVAIRETGRTWRSRWAIFVFLSAAALVLAAHSGHVSRLPQVIALTAIVVFILWAGVWRMLGQVRGMRFAVGSLAALMAAGVAIGGAGRLDDIGARWNQLEWSKLRGSGERAAEAPPIETLRGRMRDDLFIPSDHRGYPLGDRGAAYAAAMSAITDRPLFGWGPGGWPVAAAANTNDAFVRTFFLYLQFTHQDFLQTWVEWGLLGATGWLLLLPGAVVYVVAQLRTRPSHDFIGAAAAVGLAAVLIQSLIDFPLQIPAIQYNAAALTALAWSTASSAQADLVSVNFSHERL